MHSLVSSLTDAPLSHYAFTELFATRALLMSLKSLLLCGDETVHCLYLQMKLLNDAGDQPGELVHINRIDECHCLFYAVRNKAASQLVTANQRAL